MRTAALQFAEIAIHQRPHVGVDHRGAGAFELAELGRDVAGRAHVTRARESVEQRAFVHVVLIRVQQADGNRLGARSLDALPQCGDVAKRCLDGAVEQYALRRAETEFAWNQRPRGGRSEVIEFGPVLPPDGDQILEARRGDEGCLRALAFEQSVGRDR